MQVDGPFQKKIRLALLDGFPQLDELRIFVEETLGERLQNISLAGNMQALVFDLIGWARARGRLTELVIGAAADRPGNPKLGELAARFRFADAEVGENERIVLQSVPFENVSEWLGKMTRSRAAVGRFEPQPEPDISGYGSGFLVGPDVLMTNYHVVKDLPPGEPGTVVVRFGFEVGTGGAVAKGRECRLARDWLLASSPEDRLDFALVRLAERAGEDVVEGGKRGFLKPVVHTFAKDQPLIILQHPAAKPLKLALGSVIEPSVGPRVTYNVNTEGGSSGSPCFSSALDVVALHHWGGPNHNRGVRLGPILDELKAGKLLSVLG